VRVRSQKPAAVLAREADRAWSLVVLASETPPENARQLEQYARDGGNVLVVVTAPGRAGSLATIAGVPPWDIGEASVGRDVLLGEIAFNHPLFAPLAGAQFNDFTKIHFWKYRHLDETALGDARVLARFEGGDAAVVEKPIGKGRLVVLASGWSPADSQLARSSKFVPLMAALLEGRDPVGDVAASYLVHQGVPLPGESRGLTVRKPDGTTVAVEPGETSFAGTDQPGIYTITSETAAAGTGNAGRPPARPRSFAVNLDPLESKTGPLHVETLEQFGCRLANPSRKVIDREQLRQMHNAELEGRQKLWRWLILAVLGILIVEPWLAGRDKQARAARAEALTS
jgi:hypothetical protein